MTAALRPGDTAPPTPWHAATPEDCAARLGADLADGLSAAEAARRLTAQGPNRLPEPPGRTRIQVFADQFKSVLVGLLLVAGVLMLAMGEFVDAAAILAILLLNAALGYVQERRAADALAALRRMAAPSARVRREGATLLVPAADLVPGDVVVIEAGDRIPADARLARTYGFRTVEAALTGESEAVEKDADAEVTAEAAVADRRGMAFMGTTAVLGNAEGVVVATGGATEFGRIAALVRGAAEPETPLQARLRSFGKTLTFACAAVVVLVFGLGVLRGQPGFDMLLAAVSLAVAAVPEGLTAVVTITLALGVARMATRNALIRRLPAVETLGCTSVICSDKTGTLTVGEMTVRVVASLDFEAEVEGTGYGPEGAILLGGRPAQARPGDTVYDVLHAAAACCTARVVERDGVYAIAGDPTEGALLVAARKAGIAVDSIERDEAVVGSLTFDSDRKRMSIARRTSSGVRSYVKGAPESVLPHCSEIALGGRAAPIATEETSRVLALNQALAARGLRVLAIARRDFASRGAPGPAGEEGLTFLGLVGMQDPPRDSVRPAVAACRAAGIRPVMITGDQPATAFAIARDLGIAEGDSEVMSGPALEATDDAALRERVETVSVYARVSPEHKLRIVRAWQARGAVVAMTGDGVNDAPALKGADIGVAMGRSGTDVAKDAAAMVVADDDFASIVAAVEEGRRIFENIRKTLLYLLSGNLAEILVMTVAVIAGWPLPLLPIQLLWINLVTDGLGGCDRPCGSGSPASSAAPGGIGDRGPELPSPGCPDRRAGRRLHARRVPLRTLRREVPRSRSYVRVLDARHRGSAARAGGTQPHTNALRTRHPLQRPPLRSRRRHRRAPDLEPPLGRLGELPPHRRARLGRVRHGPRARGGPSDGPRGDEARGPRRSSAESVVRYEAGAPTDLGARSVLLAGAVLEHLGAVPVGRGEAVERDVLADSGAWTKIQGICEIQGGVREPPASVTDEGGDEVLECDPEPMSTMRGVSDGSGDGASHHETDGTSGMMGGGSGGGMTHR